MVSKFLGILGSIAAGDVAFEHDESVNEIGSGGCREECRVGAHGLADESDLRGR